MATVIMKEYWSKADAFLLPLTGLHKKECPYELNSFLFWKNNTIEDYKLTICYLRDNKEIFDEYCRENVFPILDKKGYLIEAHDIDNKSIFVLDMSEWAMDIEMFLAGKYSQMTQGTKDIIEKYHYTKKQEIAVYIYAVLYPKKELDVLRMGSTKMNALQYLSKDMDLDYETLLDVGEIGSKYDKMAETLITDINDICKTVTDSN